MNATTKPWGDLPAIDPNPDDRMCGVVNGRIICCRSEGHKGDHASPFPSVLRHGPVWVYWMCGGPFGSCHEGDPATHLYCGLERGHEGPHLSPSNQGPGATLAEWLAPSDSALTPEVLGSIEKIRDRQADPAVRSGVTLALHALRRLAGLSLDGSPRSSVTFADVVATGTIRQGWAGKENVPVTVHEIRIEPAPSSAPVDAPANRIDKPGRYVLTADFVNRGTISVGTLPAGTEIEITQVDAEGGKVIGPQLADWTGWDRIPCRPRAPVDDARGGAPSPKDP